MTKQEFYNAFLNAKTLMAGRDKLAYACKRFTEKNQGALKEIEEGLRDIETAHCSTDAKGNIMMDEHGRLMFTPEAEKNMKREKAEFLSQEITPEVSICTDNTRVKTLHPSFEILNGLVFNYNFWEGVE